MFIFSDILLYVVLDLIFPIQSIVFAFNYPRDTLADNHGRMNYKDTES